MVGWRPHEGLTYLRPRVPDRALNSVFRGDGAVEVRDMCAVSCESSMRSPPTKSSYTGRP